MYIMFDTVHTELSSNPIIAVGLPLFIYLRFYFNIHGRMISSRYPPAVAHVFTKNKRIDFY